MMNRQYKSLCSPAQLYVFLSVVAIIAMLLQNISDSRRYCVGMYSCRLQYNNMFLFLIKVLYVIFWTIVLDSLCKNGYTNLSWIIVLLPFIMLFTLIALFMIQNSAQMM
jgi:hypothetical protein